MKTALILGAGVIVVGTAAAIARALRVHGVEHMAGVHPALRALMGEWERVGSHEVVIAPGDTDWPIPGGVRSDESTQASAAGAGLSNAKTLAQTPHGRAAALDVWPFGFNPRRGFDVQPSMEPMFRTFGEWAERQTVLVGSHYFGFTWGGRWSTPDLPHVELNDWRQLPFPPPNYGEGFV